MGQNFKFYKLPSLFFFLLKADSSTKKRKSGEHENFQNNSCANA
jgi:hypothetical protein